MNKNYFEKVYYFEILSHYFKKVCHYDDLQDLFIITLKEMVFHTKECKNMQISKTGVQSNEMLLNAFDFKQNPDNRDCSSFCFDKMHTFLIL